MTNTFPLNILLFLLLTPILYWAWCHLVWNIPVTTLGHLSQLCLLPTSHALPTFSQAWSTKPEKVLSLYKPYAEITKHHNIMSPVFSTNLKHRTIPAFVKTILLPSNPNPQVLHSWCLILLKTQILPQNWIKQHLTPSKVLKNRFAFLMWKHFYTIKLFTCIHLCRLSRRASKIFNQCICTNLVSVKKTSFPCQKSWTCSLTIPLRVGI